MNEPMNAAQRSQLQDALGEAVGIRLPSTILPVGTALYPSGEARLADMRQELARLPDALPALEKVSGVLADEKANDYEMPASRLRLLPLSARLTTVERLADGQSVGGIAYSRESFGTLCRRVLPSDAPSGMASALAYLPPELRAKAFNTLAERATGKEPVVLRTVRVRQTDGSQTPLVRALVSNRHSRAAGDDSAIVAALKRAASLAGAKLRYTREGFGERSTFELVWPTSGRQIVVGDVLQVAIRLTNNELGSASLSVEPAVLRTLCANLTTAWSRTEDEESWRIRHVGDLSRKLPALLDRARRAVEPFVLAFGDAYQVGLPAFAPTRGEALDRVGKRYELPATTLTLAASLWDVDGSRSAGDTLGGAANALTQAAHQLPMAEASVVQRAAGRLIVEGWPS